MQIRRLSQSASFRFALAYAALFGAAVIAGKLMGLGPEAIANASPTLSCGTRACEPSQNGGFPLWRQRQR